MTEYQRYAIYYLPEGDLARFGADWLGWDVERGALTAHPAAPGGLDIAAITDTPRKYGFHGTIKPPFHLAQGRRFDELHDAFAALCADLAPVTLEALQLSNLGRFLALTPVGDQSALRALAGTVVRELDDFRAPQSEADLARRRAKGLSARQETYLTRWGYPYVMDEFRFHLTLSGSLKDAELRAKVESALNDMVTPILPAPFVFNTLCLVGSDDDGRFHLIERRTLSGTP